MPVKVAWILFGLSFVLLSGCQSNSRQIISVAELPTPKPESLRTEISREENPASPLPPATILPITAPMTRPPTLTPNPTSTHKPDPTATVTPTLTPSPTPIGPCDERLADEGLLVFVTLEYGLSRDYVPQNLIRIDQYLPTDVTLGYKTEVREVVIGPLVQMINEMLANGLQPEIISGYRSYSTQAIAWSKWLEKEPDRASIVSAPPGFSEHQLGTTIDFGSPDLQNIVGDEDVEFHTYFYKTSESQWLAESAHKYGFTLSYPREAFDLTGFYYEPWHYRYVGVELATELKQNSISLTQYLIENRQAPCIP